MRPGPKPKYCYVCQKDGPCSGDDKCNRLDVKEKAKSYRDGYYAKHAQSLLEKASLRVAGKLPAKKHRSESEKEESAIRIRKEIEDRERLRNEKNEFCWRVYSLNDPDTGEVRYIGITRTSLENRHKRHIDSALNGYTSPKDLWVTDLLWDGKSPSISLITSGTSDMDIAEQDAIREYRSDRLLNITPGGEKGVLWRSPISQRK